MDVSQKCYDWVSLGGGAAGYFGAIRFAEQKPHASVLILEATNKPLAKVKISGGGRCNVTHACFEPKKLVENYPRGHKELLSVFSRFQPKDTMAWFESKGVELKAESDGRVFPVSDSSQTIIDCFESARLDHGIELRCRSSLQALEPLDDRFALTLKNGESLHARQLLLATGSHPSGWQIARSLGHHLVDPVPSLFSFNIDDERLRNLSGRSFKQVEVSGKIEGKRVRSSGPLLITHWGLSGPSILKFSSFFARELYEANYQAEIQISFTPNKTAEDVLEDLRRHKEVHQKKKLKNLGPRVFPESYWLNLLRVLDIDQESLWADLSKKSLQRIHEELHRASFQVTGKTTNKEEFVTAGGVCLKEVDFRTMQSRLVPRLYFAGEVLDIDALTGGFNFQNAWSTSSIAAAAAFDDK